MIPPPILIFLSPLTNSTEPPSTADLALGNETFSPRKGTVSALWEQVQENGVIHVRGTPASGKSTLAILLHKYVQNIPGMDVIRFTWPARIDSKYEREPYDELLSHATNKRKNWGMLKNTLIIIDEAQDSYRFHNLWVEFIKPL